MRRSYPQLLPRSLEVAHSIYLKQKAKPIILVCFPTDVIFVQEDRVVVIFFVLTQDFEGIIVEVDPRKDKEGNKKKHAFYYKSFESSHG